MFWELLCQEPPKIFKFTQWSLDWIKGKIEAGKILGFEKNKDFLYDHDERMINTEGYLIDRNENILDQYGRIVFSNDLLAVKRGQDAMIPKVFTSSLLCKPDLGDIDNQKMTESERNSNQTTLGKSDNEMM